ncbi:MAG: sugar ABC transporter permease [Eubacteriales bacterium]|nr:sugar ABC transporter permease [Eubacteriales bacterium]
MGKMVDRYKRGIAFSSVSFIGFSVIYLISFTYSLTNVTMRDIQGTIDSGTYRLAIFNTMKFMVIAVPILFVLSFALALLMKQLVNGHKFIYNVLMAVNIFPMIVPSFIVAFVVRIFFEDYGIINGVLTGMGIQGISWLNSRFSFVLLILIYLWKYYGYCVVIFLGGLNSVDSESIEAARLDGAGEFVIALKIAAPQMKKYFSFAVIIEIISVFKVFKESSILFGDYPHSCVYMIQNYMNNCMYSLNYGKLVCAAVIMIAVFITVLLILLFKGNKENKGEFI